MKAGKCVETTDTSQRSVEQESKLDHQGQMPHASNGSDRRMKVFQLIEEVGPIEDRNSSEIGTPRSQNKRETLYEFLN
jgi:hypothetical protein